MAMTTKGNPAADYDAIVVGGGPAGLNAALYLGRARRRALVVDAGNPRNARSHASHGLFTRDGAPPRELLAEGRRQLGTYPTVEFRHTAGIRAAKVRSGFEVQLEGGDRISSRRLILACGIRDELPPIEGLADGWGTRVFNCSYCHGFEESDRPLALLAPGSGAIHSVQSLLPFSKDTIVFTNGPCELSATDRQRIASCGAQIVEAKVLKVSSVPDGLAIHLANGSVIARSAMLTKTTPHLACDLPVQLGCELSGPSSVAVDATWQTTVAGVYAVGDIATTRKSVVIAAASGADAAVCVDLALIGEDLAAQDRA
jgi:thioredoxin reductase